MEEKPHIDGAERQEIHKESYVADHGQLPDRLPAR